ncbi:MAG: NAD-dependent epimerase/dehydratase family protein [Nitrospira sp.]
MSFTGNLHSFANRHVLATGGAGFIGSAVIWGLNQRGCDNTVVVDRVRHTEKWRHLSPLRFRDYLEAGQLLLRLQNNSLGAFQSILQLAEYVSCIAAQYFMKALPSSPHYPINILYYSY